MIGPGFKLSDAYRFAAAHGLTAESREILSMRVHPGIKKKHVPRKGTFVDLFESRGLMDDFVLQYWPARNTEQGNARRQQYLDLKSQNEALLRGEVTDEDILDDVPEISNHDVPSDADLVAFAMEAQLRDAWRIFHASRSVEVRSSYFATLKVEMGESTRLTWVQLIF